MCLLNQRTNHIGPMRAGEDGHPWLKLLHRLLHLVGFTESDIRRIADHKVEITEDDAVHKSPSTWSQFLARDDIEDIALQEPHPLIELQPGGIGARYLQRFGREIDGKDFRPRQLVC